MLSPWEAYIWALRGLRRAISFQTSQTNNQTFKQSNGPENSIKQSSVIVRFDCLIGMQRWSKSPSSFGLIAAIESSKIAAASVKLDQESFSFPHRIVATL